MDPQDHVYTRLCYSGRSMRETLDSQYFALSKESTKEMPFLDQMIDNHKKCPYWTLLKHHCPCLIDFRLDRNKSKRFPRPSQRDLLKDHCSVESVHDFIRACMGRIIPRPFWGDKSNFNILSDHILQLLNLQRYGKISLTYMIQGIKRNKMLWLSEYDHTKKRDALMVCVDFLIRSFVCPLIKSYFSVVETTYAKNKMIFLRKRVWHRLHQKAMFDFQQLCCLKSISEREYHRLLKEKKILGYSRITFHLKKSSLRPICNQSTRRNGKVSINDHLKTLLSVLTFERDRQPSNFGSFVKGREDIYQKLKNFILNIKGHGKIYFLTADILKCFDSIDPHLLYKLVSQVMTSEHYRVFRYRKSVYHKNQITYKFFESVHDIDWIRRVKKGDVQVIGDYTVSREALLFKLECLLHYNVIKFGRQYYVQNKGISQGCILSSILCGIFLGFIENQVSVSLTNYDLLIRQTDDYFLASPCKTRLKAYFESLVLKLNEFHCYINYSKCFVNFDNFHPSTGQIKKTEDGYMRFSGIAINCDSYEVVADFSHYEGLVAKDVITMKLGCNPGAYVKKCVTQSLYHKCETILFDNHINSPSVILSNTLCLFCLCALKFHAFIMWLPKYQRINKNPSFFLDIILGLPSALRHHVSRRLKDLSVLSLHVSLPGDHKIHDFPLKPDVVSSLCIAAFLYKTKQHKSVYERMIPIIEKESLQFPQCDFNFVRNCFLKLSLR